jgi:thiamine biosynthesis lipoprotein
VSEGGDIIAVITRRELLKKVGTAFLIYTSSKAGLNITRSGPKIVEESRIVMGSASRITVVGEDEKKLRVSVDAAFKVMKRLEGLMTLYDSGSEISQLNKNGAAKLTSESIEILKDSMLLSRLTRGAFDITALQRIHTLKDENDLDLQQSNYKDLEVLPGAARFKKKGMAIDLGAIGIGYAVDSVINLLRSSGVKSAIVDGGGEVKAIGRKRDSLSWKVGIRNPFRKDEFTEVINLDNVAISTSGNYEKNHIVNPRTGEYPDGLVSATIISKEAVASDAISTAVFVLGEEEGLSLIDRTPDTEGLLLNRDGGILKSRGFKMYTSS